MEYTLKKQNLGITKKLIWVMKEQNLQNLFASHVFARSEMNIGETSSILRLPNT